MEAGASAAHPVTWPRGTTWRLPARPRVPAGPAARRRAPTGRAHAQGGAPPLPGGEGVYGEAAAAAAEAETEAAAMAPFPEEVDVFTAPHWRMKQLVGLYCDKVTACGASGSGRRRRRGGADRVPGRPGLRRARSSRGRAGRSAACVAVSAALPAPHLPREPAPPPAPRPATRDVLSGLAARPSWLGPASRGRGGPPARARSRRWAPSLPTDLWGLGSPPAVGFPPAGGWPFPRVFPAPPHRTATPALRPAVLGAPEFFAETHPSIF